MYTNGFNRREQKYLSVGCLIPPYVDLERYGLYVNTDNTLALRLFS